MRIDVHHHFPPECKHGCDCHRVLHAVEAMHQDLITLMTRDEVPDDVTQAIADAVENARNNFTAP